MLKKQRTSSSDHFCESKEMSSSASIHADTWSDTRSNSQQFSDDGEYSMMARIVDRIRRFQPSSNHDDESSDDLEDEEIQPPEKNQPSDTNPPQEDVTTAHDDTNASMYVLQLSKLYIDAVFGDMPTTRQVVMCWSNKKAIGQVAFAAATCTSEVHGKVEVLAQHRVDTFGELRSFDCFQQAPKQVKDLWRNRLVQEKKPTWIWNLVGVEHFARPKRVTGRVANSRCWQVSLKRIVSEGELSIPKCDLKETAMHFINRLGEDDLQRLEATMKSLHNSTIRIGTSCSGTDIAVSVTKATIFSLAQHFNASCHGVQHVFLCLFHMWVFLFEND